MILSGARKDESMGVAFNGFLSIVLI